MGYRFCCGWRYSGASCWSRLWSSAVTPCTIPSRSSAGPTPVYRPQAAGMLWSLAVAGEVVMFFLLGPWLLARLQPAHAMAIAALAGAVRWLISAVTVDLSALVLIQPLHGVTFALLHLACMRILATSVPPELAATAQAIYGTVGIGAATATADVGIRLAVLRARRDGLLGHEPTVPHGAARGFLADQHVRPDFRRGCDIVKASGWMQSSTCLQTTGSAIGKPGRARGG